MSHSLSSFHTHNGDDTLPRSNKGLFLPVLLIYVYSQVTRNFFTVYVINCTFTLT